MELKTIFGPAELRAIPEDWSEASLSALVERGSRITYGVVKPGRDEPDGVLFIRGGDISGGKVNEQQLRRISKNVSEQYARTILEGGEVLISLVGYPGEAAIVPSHLRGNNIARQVALVRLSTRLQILPDFVCKYLQSDLGRRQLLQEAIGSAQQVINLRDIQKVTVPVPPSLSEQRLISQALSDTDNLIESLEQLIAKKRQVKQGSLQELITGKRRLPGFTDEWKTKRLGDLCEILIGRTPSRLNPAYWGHDYYWLSIADLNAKVANISKEKITSLAAEEMHVVRKGTLMMSFKLSIGRLSFAGCDLYTNEAICSFNKLQAEAEFLYHALARVDFSLYGKQAVKGYTLNKESLKLVEVSLPSQEEQTAIATVLSDMDAELAALEARLAKARQIKQGMMQELLTGRIRLL